LRAFAVLVAVSVALPAVATDHDKVEAGRPLRFDDARSLHFGERTFDFGTGVNFRRGRTDGDFKLEFGYGFALDSHVKIGVSPRWGDGRMRAGDAEVEVFHALRRELRHSPALAVKAGIHAPIDGGSTAVQLRGILSRSVAQYDRMVVNVDAEFRPDARAGERDVRFGAVLGYTRPLGLPTHFDTTGLAEIALSQSVMRGEDPTVSVGVGFRRQVTVRSVLDAGLQSDLLAPRGRGVPLRLVLGYSTSF
jgi:hypothetical protein